METTSSAMVSSRSTAVALRVVERIRRLRARAGIILLYHRIDEEGSDPWGLTVHPDQFEDHLRLLREFGVPMGLREFLARRTDRKPRQPAIVVTFDDGFADNLTRAKPRLNQYQIPATVFVTAGLMGRSRECWWDELERCLFALPTLPSKLELTIRGRRHRWSLGKAAAWQACDRQLERLWRAWDGTAPTERHQIYRALYELLFPLDAASRDAVLDDLVAWAGEEARAVRESQRLLTPEELQALAADESVEIGAHTMTHPSLASLSPRQQWIEIQQGKVRLEEAIGRPITSFAFPFGRPADYSRETIALVRAAGFACACTTTGAMVSPSHDPWQLPRFTVHASDGEGFAAWLRDLLQS